MPKIPVRGDGGLAPMAKFAELKVKGSAQTIAIGSSAH